VIVDTLLPAHRLFSQEGHTTEPVGDRSAKCKMLKLYYSVCGMIDWHNRCRQDDLQLEKELGTLDWSMRVNTTLLGMCIVDTWYAYSQCTKTKEKQKDFYSFLAKELIDNKYDSVGPGSGRRNRTQDAQEARNRMMMSNNGLPTCGYGPHITPTKRRIS
jgi:hypothetical protein